MRKAGDILRVFLDRATAEKAERYGSFFARWERLVGERVAAHSEVKDLQNGTVIIEVDHPGWIQMIQMKQAHIIEILQREYPDLHIRGLRLQLPWKRRAAVSPVEERRGDAGATTEEAGAATDDSPEPAAELPADPRIRGALDRLGKAIEERKRPE